MVATNIYETIYGSVYDSRLYNAGKDMSKSVPFCYFEVLLGTLYVSCRIRGRICGQNRIQLKNQSNYVAS